ncbi:MAG: DUF2062 domain-containing protein [Rhodoferax sp.]
MTSSRPDSANAATSPTPRQGWRRWIPSRQTLTQSRWLRWAAPWLGHASLWSWSRRGVALGVALGVFFGLLIPVAQIPVTAAAAIVLRANLPVAAASTLITNPVTFAPVYYGAYRLGVWVTGGTEPAPVAQSAPGPDPAHTSAWDRIKALGKPLLVGLLILSCAAGLLTYTLVSLAWRLHTTWRWLRRQAASGRC